MQLGVSSFAFGWAVSTPSPPAPHLFDANALLAFAAGHHVPVIQFGDNLPLHAMEDGALMEFARRAHSHRIAIETGARGLTPEHLHRYSELSQRVDARLLRFVIDGQGYEPAADEVIAIIRGALPALRAANVVLGIENHDRFPGAVLRRLIDDVDSENVGVCLDTANSLGAGEGIGEVLRQLAPVCVNLHVKDFAIERLPYLMGFTVSGRSLGEGMLPLQTVLATVERHGRCQTAVVELWTPPEPEITATLAWEADWAVASVNRLRAALDSSGTPGTATAPGRIALSDRGRSRSQLD
jgi:sugar phosphate isomerase/epimerase